MKSLVRCSCGLEFKSPDETHVIQAVKSHAKDAHDLTYTTEQIKALVEVEV
jgi:predicted small metal-binding protein